MNLQDEIVQWANHKLVLAQHSRHYLSAQRQASLQFVASQVEYFKLYGAGFTPQTIAKKVLEMKGHLFNILPSPFNRSYRSSFKKLEEIIFKSVKTINQ